VGFQREEGRKNIEMETSNKKEEESGRLLKKLMGH
jgi:hypothetical protein